MDSLRREVWSCFVIRVDQQPEPASFDRTVRKPGQKFLTPFLVSNKKPTNKQFSKKNYWKNSINDLYAAYQGICAYTCFYCLKPASVDHFLPKSKRPDLAYEWSNYRLCKPRVNNHKDDSMEIIDPFSVKTGWFVLDFPSCLVRPNDSLPASLTTKISKTIEILKLNDDDVFVQERCDLMVEYAENKVTLDHLKKRYPFLALEIVRQGIQEKAQNIFKKRSAV